RFSRDWSSDVCSSDLLQAQLAELMGGLELLSDRGRLGQHYSFFGGEQLPLDEAMRVMDRLQSIEDLERAVRGVYRGEQLDDSTQIGRASCRERVEVAV